MNTPGKTTTLSCRVDVEDADFLLALDIPGATTVSDKLRHVLAEARRRRLNLQNYGDCLSEMRSLLAPFQQTIQELEFSHRLRSELISRLLEALPPLMALLVTSRPPEGEEKETAWLKKEEARLADQIFQLMEEMLRLAVSSRPPCYSPDVLATRLPPVLELAHLISTRTENRKHGD